jgi:hypothetical protein
MRAFRQSRLVIQPHQQTWETYLHDCENWQLERVAVALDTAEARCAVQAGLPRWTVNAWTQPADLGVSHHGFVDQEACVACLYLPDRERANEDRIVAEALGLPEAYQEVRQLLYTSTPISAEFVGRIAAALDVPHEPLLQFVGQPLHVFYSNAICGGVILGMGGATAQNKQTEVPMAFQSALAGIMLAAELIAHAGNIRSEAAPTVTSINLLRPLGVYLSRRVAKDSLQRCICQDADYVIAYQTKYC